MRGNVMQDLTVDPEAFRSRMRRLASARTVILLRREQIGWGPASFVMTAGCSVTINRPYLLVYVCKSGGMSTVLSPGENLTVSLLSAECTMKPGGSFIKLEEIERGAASSGEVSKNPGSIDFLCYEPLANFECRILRALPSETHDIFLCLILEVAGRPLP